MLRFETLDCSKLRRIFTCGDIHGEFKQLEQALSAVGFNPFLDGLVSVGDLVDRGSSSESFEHYISAAWFKRVLGNHDLQPREYLLGYETKKNVLANGGKWFLDKPKDIQELIASRLEDAPIALELLTPGGHRVGITHADMHARWDHLADQCNDPGQERYLVNRLTGSRAVITKVQRNYHGDYTPNEAWVHGIDHVFHGHTPIDKPITYANRTWIDTGACMGGYLTLIDIDAFLDQKG